MSSFNTCQPEMSARQQDAASTMAGAKELPEEESIDMGFLLNSAETQRLIRELLSDASLLAQLNGLVSDAVAMESPTTSHTVSCSDGSGPPLPSGLREFGSEAPGVTTKQRPGSPMGAHAPFTPAVLPTTMREDAPHVHPPTGLEQTPLNHPQHQLHLQAELQSGHPYTPRMKQTPSESEPNHSQAPPPTKMGHRGNKRIARTNFSNEHRHLLEMTFAHDHYPGSVLQDQLSHASGIPVKAIQIWFQNRRGRFKRQLGKITKKSQQSSSAGVGSSGSSWFGPSVMPRPFPEYMLMYPPSKAESSQQAGQLPRDGQQWNSLPFYQGADYNYRTQSQFTDRPLPTQAASSRDWSPWQEPMSVPPSRWGAVSPWISQNLSEHSVTSNRQRLADPSATPAPCQPSEGAMQPQYTMQPQYAMLPQYAMQPQYQPSFSVGSHQPATSSYMNSDLNWMHPWYTSYPQNAQRFTAPNATPQVGFSGAFSQQDLEPNNIQNLQDNSYPMLKSALQHGYSDNNPLLSYRHSDSQSHHQVKLPSFTFPHSKTSSQRETECPTFVDSPPYSSPDEYAFTQPNDISAARGPSTVNSATPTTHCQFLPPGTPRFTPGVATALYSNSQPHDQFSTRPGATPISLFRACDNPLMSTADEPLESPSPPVSACSFGSGNTLYIDLDAEIN